MTIADPVLEQPRCVKCGHSEGISPEGFCNQRAAMGRESNWHGMYCGCRCTFPAPETLPGTWADPDCPTLEEAEVFLRAQGVNPDDLANQFIEYLGKRHVEVVQRARSLCERLREVHADATYQGVWFSAQLHQGPYTGPTYTDELKALEDCLERKR